MCIFGWLAAITFDDYDMDNRAGTPVNELFNGLGISIYTTWLIATTADYPDQMLPSYTYARSAGIFFFVYILITVFLFVELILAVVYEGYLAYLKTRLITGNEARVAGLKAAFALIADSDGKISRASFEALVKETNRVDKIPKVSALETDYFFDILDDDRSGSISKEEFFDVCDILQYSFKKVSTTTWCERHRSQFAAGPFYSSVKRFVASPALAVTTSTLLVVNAVVVFAESYYDLTNTLTPSGEERFAMAECVFSLLYMGLLLAELLVKPFDEYWLSKTNRFDFVATIILFVAATVWVLPFVHISRDTLHYLTILRLARLVLMLLKLPSYELLGICLMKMLPASVGVMGIM